MPGELPVFISTNDDKSAKYLALKAKFDNSYFRVKGLVLEGLDQSPETEAEKHLLIFRAFLDAANSDKYAKQPVAFIKEDSTTLLSPDELAAKIKSIVKFGGFDGFYLNSYLEQCQMMEAQGNIDGMNVVKSSQPKGFLAIILTPKARRMLMGQEPMRNGKMFELKHSVEHSLNNAFNSGGMMFSTTEVPILAYDSSSANKASDYQKANRCVGDQEVSYQAPVSTPATGAVAGVQQATSKSSTSFDHNWLWVMLIVIFFVVAIFFIYWTTRKEKKEKIQPASEVN